MNDTTQIVLLPRFTALGGQVNFAAAPINIRGFSSVQLVMWRAAGVGIDEVAFLFQGSQDLSTWEAIGSHTPNDDDEAHITLTLDREWFRVVVAVTGTNPTACVWVVGDFLKRVGA